jgi:hypothetical protein
MVGNPEEMEALVGPRHSQRPEEALAPAGEEAGSSRLRRGNGVVDPPNNESPRAIERGAPGVSRQPSAYRPANQTGLPADRAVAGERSPVLVPIPAGPDRLVSPVPTAAVVPAAARPAPRVEAPSGVRAFAHPTRGALSPARPLSNATLAARLDQRSEQRPVIHVTIDRIEVRAPAAAACAVPLPKSRAVSGVSLSDYLRGGAPTRGESSGAAP